MNRTGTLVNIGVENVQNLIYFNADCMPVQHSGSVQVLHASVGQTFRFGPVVWDNRVIYQASADQTVIPLPKLSIYSNLSFNFRIAKFLAYSLELIATIIQNTCR